MTKRFLGLACGAALTGAVLAGCSEPTASDPTTVAPDPAVESALNGYADEQAAIFTKSPSQIRALAEDPSTVAERSVGDIAETNLQDGVGIVSADVDVVEVRSVKKASSGSLKIRALLRTDLELELDEDPESSWDDMHTIDLEHTADGYEVVSDKTDPEGSYDG